MSIPFREKVKYVSARRPTGFAIHGGAIGNRNPSVLVGNRSILKPRDEDPSGYGAVAHMKRSPVAVWRQSRSVYHLVQSRRPLDAALGCKVDDYHGILPAAALEYERASIRRPGRWNGAFVAHLLDSDALHLTHVPGFVLLIAISDTQTVGTEF